MVFLRTDECAEWCTQNQLELPTGEQLTDRSVGLRIELTSTASTLGVSKQLEEAVCPWNMCLLWVVDADVWRSSANLHLYYRLRQSYHDYRLISQAPGHLFLKHETADLITFVQLGVLAGWDMHILSDLNYGRVFVSHDSWVDIWRSTETEQASIAGAFNQLSGRSGNSRP